MAKNEAKIKFTAETKSFNDSIEKANDEMTELRAELRLNETQMKSTGATVENLEQKHKILSNQLKASQDKTEALTQKVNKAVEIFGENSTEVSKLKTQLLNAQSAEEKLRQAVEQCENALQEQKEEANRTESATEKLTKTIDKQQDELNELKAEYKEAVLQYGKTSDEAKSLAKKIDDLSGDLAENKKEMSEAEKAADDLDQSLRDAGNGAEEASEGFTVLKGAMADLVADGIEKVADGLMDITKEAFTTANDIDKATNTFIAKTGESVDSSERFETIMTDIYNGNYGESFEDIADSMAIVKTSLGDLSDDELKSVTTDALVLRDTFDMDVNESILAANSLMNQYGLTADEAFSLIAQGAQNGLNQNGDLLDVVNEYAVQFKTAGYSAEDMFNMLANGAETGTWSVDKLGDAVKEFNIRASDGTVGDSIRENAEAFGLTSKEAEKLAKGVESGNVGAYQKLREKLLEVNDDTKRYQLGVEMFGTMWEDLGEKTVLSLLDTQGEISKTEDALEEINSVKYDDLGSTFEGIKRNLQTSVAEPIKENVMPVVNEFIEDTDWEGVGQTIGEAFGTVVEGAVAIGKAIADATSWMSQHKGVVVAVATAVGVLTTAIGLYNAVQVVKTAMDAAQVTTVWALVAAHWAQATAAMAAIAPYVLIVAAIAAVIAIIVLCVKHWDKIVEACKNCWESVKASLSTWGEWINANVIEPVKQFFSNLWQSIQNIWSSITSACKKAWDAICNVISVGVQLIGSILSAAFQIITLPFRFIWENCKEYVFAAWNWMKDKISTVASSISSKISSIFSNVRTFFSNIWNSCKSVVSNTWTSIRNTVANIATAVFSKISDIWNSVKSITSSVFDSCKSVVTSVWSGIKNSVSNAVNSVRDNVSNVWNNIKSTTLSVFESCFSAVSEKFGKIKSKITETINGARDAVKSAIDKMKGFFNFSWSLPKIKLPHFKISGSFSLNPPKAPKFSVDWYKDGGIFTKPTFFNTPYGMKGVGEAGAEAVLPIDKLEGYISGAIEKTMNVVNLQSLADAIEDIASRPINISINDRQFIQATASAGDSINGLRASFKTRGLALE